jgi:hypothetical protein
MKIVLKMWIWIESCLKRVNFIQLHLFFISSDFRKEMLLDIDVSKKKIEIIISVSFLSNYMFACFSTCVALCFRNVSITPSIFFIVQTGSCSLFLNYQSLSTKLKQRITF